MVSRDQCASGPIAKAVLSNIPSPNCTVRLKQPQGLCSLPVHLGSVLNSNTQNPLTAKDLVQVQVNTGLSNLKTKKLASTLNNISTKKG